MQALYYTLDKAGIVSFRKYACFTIMNPLRYGVVNAMFNEKARKCVDRNVALCMLLHPQNMFRDCVFGLGITRHYHCFGDVCGLVGNIMLSHERSLGLLDEVYSQTNVELFRTHNGPNRNTNKAVCALDLQVKLDTMTTTRLVHIDCFVFITDLRETVVRTHNQLTPRSRLVHINVDDDVCI
jgi:hypothetical protein